MSEEKSLLPASKKGTNSRNLIKKIFAAEVPEAYIKSIPAQSLYLAVKQQGLDSAGDLISISSKAQCQLMLDFDLWEKDCLVEENFWEWLALPDQQNELEILEKLLTSIDLKLVAIILARYVKVQVFEEATEKPPAIGYYSPDKGHTWLLIDPHDSTKHFLLGRFLAFVFDINAEVFYQLLAVPQIETPSALEEQAYQEKTKRLLAEGIPDDDYAHSINSPLDEKELKMLLDTKGQQLPVKDLPTIDPLCYDAFTVQPLATLLTDIENFEEFESELSLIMNAAIVYWKVPTYDYEAVFDLMAKVKGAINIGLEISAKNSELNSQDIYKRLGLQKLYRLGLGRIFLLRKLALNINEASFDDATTISILDALKEPFPRMPMFFKSDGSFEEEHGKLLSGFKAIEKLKEAESLLNFVKEKIN